MNPEPRRDSFLVGKSLHNLVVELQRRAQAPGMRILHLRGPSGVGKDLFAREFHRLRTGGDSPFLRVNCAALTPEILRSELFGYVRGAFTGADRDKPGRFDDAGHGTIFLDEIGDLPYPCQGALLQVLDRFTYSPVGSGEERAFPGSVVAATLRDLMELTNQGKFRSDLLARLGFFPIRIPPLAERRADIPELVLHFALTHPRRENAPAPRFSRSAMSILKARTWEGNVRELRDTVDQLIEAAQYGKVTSALIRGILGVSTDSPSKPRLTPESIRAAYANAEGSWAKAAEILGTSRSTLYRYLDKWPFLRRSPHPEGDPDPV